MTQSRAARMVGSATTLLTTASAFVHAEMYSENGARCPCCNAYVKVKEYRLTRSLATSLRQLRELGPVGESFHTNDWFHAASRMYYILKHAGLITQVTDDPTKPFDRSGEWCITPLGAAWLSGVVTVPRAYYVVFDELLGVSEEQITVGEAHGSNWSPEDAASSPIV